jgi:hypothetical protein
MSAVSSAVSVSIQRSPACGRCGTPTKRTISPRHHMTRRLFCSRTGDTPRSVPARWGRTARISSVTRRERQAWRHEWGRLSSTRYQLHHQLATQASYTWVHARLSTDATAQVSTSFQQTRAVKARRERVYLVMRRQFRTLACHGYCGGASATTRCDTICWTPLALGAATKQWCLGT